MGELVGIAEHRLLVACLFHEHFGLFPLPVIIMMTGGESRRHATHCECRDDKQYFQPSLHSACKDNANRVQYKMKGQKTFIFIAEVPLILSKYNAKIRLSERNGNLFTFPSEKFLSKSRAMQNKFIYFHCRDATYQYI